MAAVDYFLKIDGISGESTDESHKDEIEVESFSWGVSQTATRSGGAGAGRAVFQDLHFAAPVSKASPNVFLKCATGQHIKQAVLTARRAGGEQREEFLKITLTDVLVSSYQSTGANPGPPEAPADSVALRYASAKLSEGAQQHIDITPAALGVLRFNNATQAFEIVESPNGVMTIGTGDGVVSRAVQEYDVRDLLGLLTGPFPSGRLHLSITEVRQAARALSENPGSAREGAEPHLHFDVVLYEPADLALTPEDLTRRGRRIGSLHLDPRRDPTAVDLDLTSSVRDGTFGIRLQLRGAPVVPPPDADHPPDPGREADEVDDVDEHRGRSATAAFTLSLAYDTA